MSGNGAYIPNRNGTLQPFPIPDVQPGQAIYTAPGTGGGYVQEGPFVNWTLHLVSRTEGCMPIAKSLTVLGTVLQPDGRKRHRRT